MNKHLKLVREFNDTFLLSQTEPYAYTHLSDMDIVKYQALLMEEGSGVLKALRTSEMVDILASLVILAYCALDAIARQGGEVSDSSVTWKHDGFVVSIMRILSEKINHCTSGSTEDYSAVYCLCAHLARCFINADFDKAFSAIHNGKMSKLAKAPDLSECLFE
ncbi:MAG: nucleoside triphosphate pyrophosphohydrolase family protein [Methylococcaceae bacterium]